MLVLLQMLLKPKVWQGRTLSSEGPPSVFPSLYDLVVVVEQFFISQLVPSATRNQEFLVGTCNNWIENHY